MATTVDYQAEALPFIQAGLKFLPGEVDEEGFVDIAFIALAILDADIGSETADLLRLSEAVREQINATDEIETDIRIRLRPSKHIENGELTQKLEMFRMRFELETTPQQNSS